MTEVRDLIGEILALSEDPREPMATYARIDLRRPIDEEILRKAVEHLMQIHEKLASFPTWEGNRVVWRPILDTNTAVDTVVVSRKKTVAEFYSLAIPFGIAPVWRVKLDDNHQTIHLATHHIMADGVATFNLILMLIEASKHQQNGSVVTPLIDEKQSRPPPPEKKFLWTLRLLRTLIKQKYLAVFYPSVLVGQRSIVGQPEMEQFYSKLSEGELKNLKDTLRGRPVALPILDLMLTAFHLALDDHAKTTLTVQSKPFGGKNRITILFPFDRRSYQILPEILWNCVGTINIHSYKKDRQDIEKLISTVKKQVETLSSERRHSSSYTVVEYILKSLERRSKKKIKPRTQPKKLKPSKAWRGENTACLSYVQMRNLPAQTAEFVDAVYGAPPVRTPLGVSIGVAEMRGCMTFCLRYSTGAIAKPQAFYIFQRFLFWMKEIGGINDSEKKVLR